MHFCVVNSKGELYAGFEDGKPHWLRTKRDDCLLSEDTANQVLRQLHHLGFTDTALRNANEIARKWVPAKTDAAAL